MKYLLTLILFVSLNVFSDPKGYVLCCATDNATTFIDPSTIVKDGTKRRVWTVTNFSREIKRNQN